MRDIVFLERDPFAPIRHAYPVEKVLYHGKSEYQEIVILESPHFGRILVLDGVAQCDERYEFVYHEFLAHIPMFAHPEPKDVLIIGGGDGGTLREVLKHPEVQRAVLVDIDRMVIEVSKEYLPSLACSFNDPRVEVFAEDGFKFVQNLSSAFDVILVDSTDPVGFAHILTTTEFFRYVFKALKEDGIYAGQSESLHYHLNIVQRIQKDLREVFPIVDLYCASVPGYAGYWWSFSIGSKSQDPRKPLREKSFQTKLYSKDMHEYAFLPKSFISKILSGEYNA